MDYLRFFKTSEARLTASLSNIILEGPIFLGFDGLFLRLKSVSTLAISLVMMWRVRKQRCTVPSEVLKPMIPRGISFGDLLSVQCIDPLEFR